MYTYVYIYNVFCSLSVWGYGFAIVTVKASVFEWYGAMVKSHAWSMHMVRCGATHGRLFYSFLYIFIAFYSFVLAFL